MRTSKSPLPLLLIATASCTGAPTFAPQPLVQVEPSHVIDGVRFEAGNWNPDLPAGNAGRSRGNHRAVVRFTGEAKAVLAHIPWRRPDANPAGKDVLVVDAATDEVIPDRLVLRNDNEAGDVVFRPRAGSDTYHVYYFPYETTGRQYPVLTYLPPQDTADVAWRDGIGAAADLPRAQTLAVQSIDRFHSFFPMEVIATGDEVEDLLAADQHRFHLFPEDRTRSIRLREHVPHAWVARGLQSTFRGEARRGEYYTFQIGVRADNRDLADVGVTFTALVNADGYQVGPEAFTCFNAGGVNEKGQPFTKNIDVAAGEVQALWIGVQVPLEVRPGEYCGAVSVSAEGCPARPLDLHLRVTDEVRTGDGDERPQDMSRLRWLNSTVGSDPDFIIEPFHPVRVSGHALSILGRDVELDASGLPTAIRSWFSREMTGLADAPEDVLAAPLALEVTTAHGTEAWASAPFRILRPARGRAEWSTISTSNRFTLGVEGALEYDGMLDYRLTLTAREDVDVADVALPIALVPDAARYMLGLGRRGGRRPAVVDWKWKVENHQEGVWLGGVHKGLQYVLRDRNYERPLNTNFYLQKPLNLPPSWHNDGRGGIRITTADGAVTARNYSGPRHLTKGDALHFHIRLLLTPFKPLDTVAHFNTRFVHRFVPVDTVREWGGTVVNIHHANTINPYINYPFFNLDEQRAYIDEAHAKGIKVKLYYTIRELTYKAHELFALRSLDDEILNDGAGGGHSWMQEHLRDRYHSAWHAWRVDDAALLNKGTSRWTNYYVEGLRWLAEHQGIDGLYLDDIAFSRETVKRMVAVLQRHRDEVVIDLHSANQFNPNDGFINSAFLYMEHFPFLSRLWFGEYFEYDRDPDYWLTEVSGLPFGLMGEMLQDGGHPYRGLIYGMTTRIYGAVDPRPIWQMMDAFGIADSRMLGPWLDTPPVRTDHDRILATAYVRDDAMLIVLASWTDEDAAVRLTLDRSALGLTDSVALTLVAPEVEGLQPAATLDVTAPIPVSGGQGSYLLLTWESK